jgi:hypothetical protein
MEELNPSEISRVKKIVFDSGYCHPIQVSCRGKRRKKDYRTLFSS